MPFEDVCGPIGTPSFFALLWGSFVEFLWMPWLRHGLLAVLSLARNERKCRATCIGSHQNSSL